MSPERAVTRFLLLAASLSWWPSLGRLHNPWAAALLPIEPSVAALALVAGARRRTERRAMIGSLHPRGIGTVWVAPWSRLLSGPSLSSWLRLAVATWTRTERRLPWQSLRQRHHPPGRSREQPLHPSAQSVEWPPRLLTVLRSAAYTGAFTPTLNDFRCGDLHCGQAWLDMPPAALGIPRRIGFLDCIQAIDRGGGVWPGPARSCQVVPTV